MISDIEDYFLKGCGRCARFGTADCATQLWSEALAELRAVCHEVGLEETVKWGQPCYMYSARNIAIIGAFRDDIRLSFFDASLLKDHQQLLEHQGPNTQHADALRFSSAEQVVSLRPTIRAYLQEAKGNANAGLKPAKSTREYKPPDELVSALDSDPELAEAFFALTPGRQRSYIINLLSAKRPETRKARIAKFRAKIISGKGATER